MPLEERIAEELKVALRHRQIARGVAILTGARADLMQIQPDTPNAASLLLLLAQWVDVGYPDEQLLGTLLQRFSPECRKKLCVDDYSCLVDGRGGCGNRSAGLRLKNGAELSRPRPGGHGALLEGQSAPKKGRV